LRFVRPATLAKRRPCCAYRAIRAITQLNTIADPQNNVKQYNP
jgi:hypothetical protein